MHIITSEGKIVEGQELTAEEVGILKELTTDGGMINHASDAYIADRTAMRIAKYLIETFRITRRQPLVSTVEEVVELELPTVDPVVASVPIERVDASSDLPF